MKYYKVWSKCCYSSEPIELIDKEEAEEEVKNTVLYYDGVLTQTLRKAFEDEDDELIEKEENRLCLEALKMFYNMKSWSCGDYAIEIIEDGEEEPTRPNSLGDDVNILLEK